MKNLQSTFCHTFTDSFIINNPTQSGTFTTVNELLFTHYNPPESIVYIRVHSRFYYVEVFNILTAIQQYRNWKRDQKIVCNIEQRD